MPRPPENTTLKSQYTDKVSTDLAQNTAEQERIRTQIASLQEQLSRLEQDHELLVGMRAALGEAAATVPAPRGSGKKTATAKPASVKKTAAKKTAAKRTAAKKATAKTAAPKKTARKTTATKPTPAGERVPALAELIHEHLSGQSEPRTAGEIAKALAEAHPHRNVNDNLVRTTTERLVARSRVERTKQGSTVYYTALQQDDSASTADKELAPAGA